MLRWLIVSLLGLGCGSHGTRDEDDRDGGSGDASTSCDLDGDGEPSFECGGLDCDDGDPTTHPGAVDPDLAWTVETAADLDCDGTDIVVDEAGRVRIACGVESDLALHVVTLEAGEWRDEIVEETTGDDPSIVVDAAGSVHVAYGDGLSEDAGLRHAWNVDDRWSTQLVDRGVTIGLDTSLVIDGGGSLHIGYVADGAFGSLEPRWATNGTGAWVVEPLGSEASWVSLAVDDEGNPRMALGTSDGLAYAWRDDGRWLSATVDPTGVGTGVSLAREAGGDSHVTWQALGPGGGLRHAAGSGGLWTVDLIDDDFGTGRYSSVGVDARGVVHVVYHDAQAQQLRWAHTAGVGWKVNVIDSRGDAGWHAALAVGADALHASWVDRAAGRLRYGRIVPLDGIDRDCSGEDGSGTEPDPCVDPDRDDDGHEDVDCGGDDCDDTDRAFRPGAPDELGGGDRDCDGVDGVDADGDGFVAIPWGGTDCDDADARVHPGAADPAGDGFDDDCDGTDGRDADGDGWASEASGGSDCDDTDDAVHPDAPDDVGDGDDTNCDGIDGTDDDGDGFVSAGSGGDDCDDGDPAVHPGAADDAGNGVDEDCDDTDGVDADGDGRASEASGGDDCDDAQVAVHPGAADLVGDGVDQSCDGLDGIDADADGFASALSLGDDCDDADALRHPGAADAFGDGIDQSCDGIDGVDADSDGFASEASGGGDCDDGDATVHPGAAERAGEDANCDGVVGVDGDGDGHLSIPTGGDDCEDGDAAIHPGALDGTWISETVDDGAMTGMHSSLAVDGADVPHVAYYDNWNGDARYATKRAGVWVRERIDGTDNVGRFPSLAVAADGTLHVSYDYDGDVFDATDDELHYAVRSAGVWSVETIEEDASLSTLALDSAGTVHVVYRAAGLRYATNGGGAWAPSDARVGGNVGPRSLVADAGDVLHLLVGDGDLFHDWNDGAGWSEETAVVLPLSASDAAVAVEPSGDLCVVYRYVGGSIRYARKEAGSWSSEIVDDPGAGTRPSIAVDPDGNAHVCYENGLADEVRCATNRGGAWTVEIEDEVGWMVSLAAGPGGLHRTWATQDEELWYARRAFPDGIDSDCDGAAW